jgi:hypothetical protein
MSYQDDFMRFELSKLGETDPSIVGVVSKVASEGNVGEFVILSKETQRLNQVILKIAAR